MIRHNGILLIHPPVVKPCEPPAGISKLSGALIAHGINHSVLDLNLECLLAVLSGQAKTPSDTWTLRAQRNLHQNISILRSWKGYGSTERYRSIVTDLHRIFQVHGGSQIKRLSFSDYQHIDLSPLRSADLLKAAEEYKQNFFYPYFRDSLRAALEKTGTDLVGLSLNYLSQALCTFAIIGFIKETMPDVQVVLGGSLVTSWIRVNVWKNQFQGIVDHAVAGPGEYPLLALLGCTTEKNQQYCPSFHDFPLGEYLAPGPILPYNASTGCYWSKCAFCPENAEGSVYTGRSKNIIAKELQSLSSELQPVLIHFVDNAISPVVMAGLCSNSPGVSWYGFARLTNHLASLDFCRDLRRSGCVMLKLGLESGSQAVLNAMNKGNNLERSSRALKSLNKAGIATYVYLLFGTPWETEVEAQETLEFVVRHSPYIDFLNMAVFNLPNNSPEATQLNTRDFYVGDLSLYTGFSHPSGWDRKSVKTFLDKKFRRHPAIQSILRRHPPGFGSNHAPLFSMRNEGKPIPKNS